MLLRGIVAVSLYTIILLEYGGSTRIFFSKCDTGGFVCKTIAKNGTNALAVSLTCPTEDITLYVHQFHSPYNIESLEITNCQNVTISFRCFDKRQFFQTLSISNVSFLKIDNQPYTSLPPKIVQLENINYIETIPSFTFTQAEKGQSCKDVGKEEFRQIFLKNLTIDTIQSNAFRIPHKCENFTIQNVKVNRIQTAAIFVQLEKGAEFIVESSEFEVVEHLAFQVTGMSVQFRHNKFVDIAASGINGTIENFTFAWNLVNTLQSYAISILCTHTKIMHNKFEYLKSGAFEKVSPGLLEEANKSFGKLMFIYEFKFNAIKYMDAGSLHPDYIAYQNVATDMVLKKNSMLCSCYNIDWIFPGNSHGHISQYLDTFYELLLDKDSENACLSVCNFPLYLAIEVFKQGKCPESDTPDLICMKTTNAIPTAPIPKSYSKEMTAAARMSKKNSSANQRPSSLLLVFALIYGFTIL